MSEPIWCNIHFRIPPTWGTENDLITLAAECLINGEAVRRDDDDPTLWYLNGEGNYGLYDSSVEELLDWLREHDVPFVASCDPKYEFDGEAVVNDGHREWRGTSGSEQALLSKSEWQTIESGESEFRTVEEFFTILNRSRPDFPIDHLSTRFPDDEEDNEPPPPEEHAVSHDPYFEPEWCERCGAIGHNGLRCPEEAWFEDDDDE